MIRIHDLELRRALGALMGSALLAAIAGCSGPMAPEYEPRITVAQGAAPDSFHPLFVLSTTDTELLELLHAELLSVHPETGELVGELAEAWTVSPNRDEIRLVLRRDVRFSDGEPFDADDVVFTFETYLEEDNGYRGRHFLMVDGAPLTIEKVSSHEVVFRLPGPYAVGAHLLSDHRMLPSHRADLVLSREGDGSQLPGLGPYVVSSVAPGDRTVFERNPYYFKVDGEGARLPYLDEVVVLTIPEAGTRALRFENGDLSMLSGWSPASFELYRERSSQRFEDVGPGSTIIYLFFNLRPSASGGAWMRPEFREAVDLAVDRRAIAELAYGGLASPTRSLIPSTNRRFFDPELAAATRDLEGARDRLREAGFSWSEGDLLDPAGTRVVVSLIVRSTNDRHRRMGELLERDLNDLGIDVRITELEGAALMERLGPDSEFEMLVIGLTVSDGDPNTLMGILQSSSSFHLWRPSQESPATSWEAEIDKLMTRQMTAVDDTRRAELFGRVQGILATQRPLLPLVNPHVAVAYHRDLANVRPRPLGSRLLWNVEEIRWQPSR